MAQSDLEAAFDYYWRVLDGPPVETEYRFDPERKFKFDRACQRALVAIELDGGTWLPGGGRHNRAAGYTQDCIKMNLAIVHGWRVFRLTSDMIQNDPQKHIGGIIEFINNQIANGNT